MKCHVEDNALSCVFVGRYSASLLSSLDKAPDGNISEKDLSPDGRLKVQTRVLYR